MVEADIKYPTDSGLLTSAVCRIASRLRRLTNAGVKVAYIDRTSVARALQHSIGVWLRRRSDEAKAEVLAITGQLADLAAEAVTEATKVLRYQARRRRVRRLLEDLTVLVERTMRVIDQARTRVHGDQPAGATRLVSLHEPDARPIRKGRLGKPVEFGYKAQVIDNPDGLIVDHSVHIGNPADTDLLRPAIERVATQLGVAPSLVTADRGYWDSTIESDLGAAGVSTVVIPRTGKPSAARASIEHAAEFVDTVKWRIAAADNARRITRLHRTSRVLHFGPTERPIVPVAERRPRPRPWAFGPRLAAACRRCSLMQARSDPGNAPRTGRRRRAPTGSVATVRGSGRLEDVGRGRRIGAANSRLKVRVRGVMRRLCPHPEPAAPGS